MFLLILRRRVDETNTLLTAHLIAAVYSVSVEICDSSVIIDLLTGEGLI